MQYTTKKRIGLITSVITLVTLGVYLVSPYDVPTNVAAAEQPAAEANVSIDAAADTSTQPVVTDIATAAKPATPAPAKVASKPAAKPAPAPKCQATATKANTVVVADICLNAPVQRVGLTANGEIDTPVSNVGLWGVEPGTPGTSLLDGHVFGVFSRLSQLRPGAIVSVNTNGKTHSFKIVSSEVIALDKLYLNGKWQSILYPNDGVSHVTFITCAGKPLGGNQYSHRLFVYAVLV